MDFSIIALRNFLWHDNIDTRVSFVDLAKKDPVFIPRHNLNLKEERDLSFKRLKVISDAKLFSVKDFWTNPRNIFTGILFVI